MSQAIVVVGGGLAGSEAAWQIAEMGFPVRLYEMRPAVTTGAHQSGHLAELVCSNSLGSKLPDRASGALMAELRKMGSLLLQTAERVAVPAGGALAVDRQAFSERVTERLSSHPQIEIIREEVETLPNGLCVVATGPLTSASFSRELAEQLGSDHLYFYDALSPIVESESIDMSVAYRASRYGRGVTLEGDYINCPLEERDYEVFLDALIAAERIPLREFEAEIESGVRSGLHTYFEGCLPVEALAERGRQALAYGPMRPVGLTNPRTGKRPYAVVQLRQDNLVGDLFNMVGFQTNLRYPEQRRVFRLIPGLEQARFARYGQMHRNTFVNSPSVLQPTLQLRKRADVFLAGQITGVEGYLGNIATGLLAGLNAARLARGGAPLSPPPETMLGALLRYVTQADAATFQPMKANFGILPSLPGKPPRGRRLRAQAYAERAAQAFDAFWSDALEKCA